MKENRLEETDVSKKKQLFQSQQEHILSPEVLSLKLIACLKNDSAVDWVLG